MLISIREARLDDVEPILALWIAADATRSVTDTPADVRRAIELPHAALLVAETDGRLIGSVIGGFDGWRGNIYRLVVDPAHRRRGVGRMLLEAVGDRLRQWGTQRVSALVEKDHERAVAFWNSTSYMLDERMVRYVGFLGPERSV